MHILQYSNRKHITAPQQLYLISTHRHKDIRDKNNSFNDSSRTTVWFTAVWQKKFKLQIRALSTFVPLGNCITVVKFQLPIPPGRLWSMTQSLTYTHFIAFTEIRR